MAKKGRSFTNNSGIKVDYSDYSAYLNQDSFDNTQPPKTDDFTPDPFSSNPNSSFNQDMQPTLFNNDPFSSIDPFGWSLPSFDSDPFGSNSSSFDSDPFGSNSTPSFNNDPFGSTSMPSSFENPSFDQQIEPAPVFAYDPVEEANRSAQIEVARIAEENAQKVSQLESIKLVEEKEQAEKIAQAQLETAKLVEKNARKEAEVVKAKSETAIENIDSLSIAELKEKINFLKVNPGGTIDEKLLVFDQIGKYSEVLLKKLKSAKK